MQYFARITIEDFLVFTHCGFSASNYNVSLKKVVTNEKGEAVGEVLTIIC
jgi:hypothetical protein